MAKKRVAQSAWSDVKDEPTTRLVAPDPEVPATVLELDDPRIPGGARRVLKKVGEGWTTRVTYARGPYLSANGQEVLRTVDSVLVRGYRDDLRFSAVWLDGKFDFAYAGVTPERVSAKKLKELVA